MIYKTLHETQPRTPLNKRQRIPKEQSRMDNPAKLATQTQDGDKQSNNTTQYALDTTMYKQTQIT